VSLAPGLARVNVGHQQAALVDIPRQHGAMTLSGQPGSPATPEIIVRDYADSDYGACRSGGHIDLTMDLAARSHEWRSGASLHGLDFGY